MTREFMLCITALSFTSMTPKRSWSLWKVKRSESWSQTVVAQGRLKLRRAFFATSSNGASEPAMTIIGC